MKAAGGLGIAVGARFVREDCIGMLLRVVHFAP